MPAASNVSHVKIVPHNNGPQMRDFITNQAFGTIPPLTTSDISNPNDRARTIIITGANSGLGLEAAKQLVQLGIVQHLILACRNADKGRKARDTVLSAARQVSSNVEVGVWELDMSKRASIKAFADRAERELDRIDAVILNAGVDLVKYEKVGPEDGGYEMSLMVNVVGTIVLAALLVPVLRRKQSSGRISRLTIVGSTVQLFAQYQVVVDAANEPGASGVLHWLSDEDRWKGKITKERYYLSKGLLQMLVGQLAQRITTRASTAGQGNQIILNCVNPGWCRTDLFKDSGTFGSRMGLRLIGWDAPVGARALLIGAVGIEGGQKSHGGFMNAGKLKRCNSWFETQQGQDIAIKLWQEVSRDIESTCPDAFSQL